MLLWDFGDTLVDERWMHRAPHGCPDWPNAWARVMADHADVWNVGIESECDIFAVLSEQTGLRVDDVERHADECCRTITFHPVAWRIASERHRPQALVTVNPDLFVDRVVGAHDLDRVFDTIVVSASEGLDDKTRLCEIALRRLGYTGPRRQALLIDNRPDLTESWERNGGSAYWYRGDPAFEADLARGVPFAPNG